MDQERTTAEEIAAFALRVDGTHFAEGALDRLKRSVLDALGCAIGALGSEPVRRIRGLVEEFGGAGRCTLVGGGTASPDRAALVNGCLVRYLDFMDNAASRGEVCHPSDNLAALLAAAEYAGRSGRDLLLGLGIAYQVQTRLMESLPTMRAGLNYTTPLAFSVAAGAARLLGLDQAGATNALALAGVSAVSLAVIQAEPVSQWKGLASGETAGRALHNTFLAARGITGPVGVFDGPYGLDHLVRDHCGVNWSREALDVPLQVSIKRHNAEFQSQSAVDAAVELHDHGLAADRIVAVRLDIARGAYDVIGGGSYGSKEECRTKEQADHSLQYLIAVALLDGRVWPEQFATGRINAPDVQALLHKVTVRPSFLYTRRVPQEMPCRLTLRLDDGSELEAERTDYDGFFTRPMSWDDVAAKFDRLAAPFAGAGLRSEIVAAVRALETLQVSELTALLARAGEGGVS